MDSNQEMSSRDSLIHIAGWAGIAYRSGLRGSNLVGLTALGTMFESVSGLSAADIIQELERELRKVEKQNRKTKGENKVITPELQFPSLDMPGLIVPKAPKTQVSIYSKWQEVIKHPALVVVLGGRGEGKSAFVYWLVEGFRYSLTPYVVGFPENKKSLLPDWMGIEQKLGDVPPGSIIIVDEAYLSYHSREWQKTENKKICALLNQSRQNNKTIIFIAQQGRQIDIDIVSSADVLVVKNPGMLQPKFDRPEFRGLLKEAQQAFRSIKGDVRRWSYVYSKNTSQARLMENDLPTFWGPELSNVYANAGDMALPRLSPEMTLEEKKQKAKELHEARWSFSRIKQYLGVASKGTIFNWIHDYPYKK